MTQHTPKLSVHFMPDDLAHRLNRSYEEAVAIMRALDSHDDLLAALKGLEAEYGIDVTSVRLLTERCRAVWGRAGAAIAKAEEGS